MWEEYEKYEVFELLGYVWLLESIKEIKKY